ncbi:MAG: hypothetical protein Q4C96_07230 [Planctomycetia bacterium]|nr:hypothetical protein [Planctomycetia bacterium]
MLTVCSHGKENYSCGGLENHVSQNRVRSILGHQDEKERDYEKSCVCPSETRFRHYALYQRWDYSDFPSKFRFMWFRIQVFSAKQKFIVSRVQNTKKFILTYKKKYPIKSYK